MGEEWGAGGAATAELGEGGQGGAGVRGSQKAAGPVSPSHTQTGVFFLGGRHICIILRVLNVQPVSYSYFNKATNQ